MAIFRGDDRDDVFRGTGDTDVIAGLGGNDHLNGRDGNDALAGGAGADRLDGGRGDDLLFADSDDPKIDGGRGTDVIILDGSPTFEFGRGSVRNVEGIQDIPSHDSSVTFDLSNLRSADADHFVFALGDGDDEVRLTGREGDIDIEDGKVVFDDRITIDFEGVERVSLIDSADGTSTILSRQTTFANDGQFPGFSGPGSPAAKAAAAVALSQDPEVSQQADITKIADLLSDILKGRDGRADIDQTAAILQHAFGRGDVDQFASILQDATVKGNGTIDQQAVIDQIAKAVGGNVDQTATIVQDAVVFGLGAKDHDRTMGNIDQRASIEQDASASGGGSVAQRAVIDQDARALGGDVSQMASIDQSASVSGNGPVSQDAHISQDASVGSFGSDIAADYLMG